MSSKVFRSGTNRDFGFVDLDTYTAPLGQGVEVDASLDEGLGQLFSPCFKSVSPDGEGTLGLVGLEELNHFGGV